MKLRRYNELFEVKEIYEILEEGITCPLKCSMIQGISAVVKYPMNPVGTEALINEWVGNSIADLVGLTIPRYGICKISEEVIEQSEVYGDLDASNSGMAFFSEYISNTAPSTPSMLEKASNKEAERLLLFDHLIKNEDRHNGNLIGEIATTRRVFFIDCSHFMSDHGRLHNPIDLGKELSISEIRNNHLMTDPSTNKGPNIYQILCNKMGFDEEILWSENDSIKRVLTKTVLTEIKESIPNEWRNAHSSKRIEDMFMVMQYRIDHLDDICDMIIVERRRDK